MIVTIGAVPIHLYIYYTLFFLEGKNLNVFELAHHPNKIQLQFPCCKAILLV